MADVPEIPDADRKTHTVEVNSTEITELVVLVGALDEELVTKAHGEDGKAPLALYFKCRGAAEARRAGMKAVVRMPSGGSWVIDAFIEGMQQQQNMDQATADSP